MPLRPNSLQFTTRPLKAGDDRLAAQADPAISAGRATAYLTTTVVGSGAGDGSRGSADGAAHQAPESTGTAPARWEDDAGASAAELRLAEHRDEGGGATSWPHGLELGTADAGRAASPARLTVRHGTDDVDLAVACRLRVPFVELVSPDGTVHLLAIG